MVELAEDELRNFGKVWLAVTVSLGYCYIIGKITSKGTQRLIAVLPVIILFLLLPLHLTSIHLCGFTAFLISWLANFKLLLFAFGKPPLCSASSASFPRFCALACLPIQVQKLPPIPDQISERGGSYSSPRILKQSQKNKSYPSPKKLKNGQNYIWRYIVKGISFTSILRVNDYRDSVPQKLLWLILLLDMYLALDTILTGIASAGKYTLGLSLESQFMQPLLCTSLQDFWGNRWNLMATNILKSTIYEPTKNISIRIVGRQMTTYTAVMVTFLVSAMMHELIFYYIGRLSPTFEVTWYFLLQGLSVCLEIAAKKYVGGKWLLPQWVSGAAALSFEVATVFWLFLPPLLRTGMENRALQDYAAVYKFIRMSAVKNILNGLRELQKESLKNCRNRKPEMVELAEDELVELWIGPETRHKSRRTKLIREVRAKGMEKMVELAEDEMVNFIKVWLSVFVSLSYCYIIGKVTPKGFTRLVAILPIIFLFLALPLNLTSIHLCGLTSFFVSWLANFKLLLFAFGKPPLSYDPPLSFLYFLLVACLPIKLQPKSEIITTDPSHKNLQISQNGKHPDHKTTNKSYPSSQKVKVLPKISPWNYIIKVALLAVIVKLYDYSDQMPQKLLWLLYGFHIYFALEIILACVARLAKFFLGLELEPQFNEPLLATSLQDFWGRRWNLMVTSILRPTVYLPTLNFASKLVGKEVGKLLGVLTTFGVSAIYHELIFYYLGRVAPTYQVTWFFTLHGVCLCVEMAVKKYTGGKTRFPRWLSGVATVGFVIGTGLWLFLPPLLRAGLATKGLHEYAVVGTFVRRLVQV